MEIRSYRRVFDLERRLYRIDRLRLNPGGVPVRGIVYFLLLLALALLAGALPVLGALLRVLPWYMRDVVLPAASAALLGAIRVEGRPFHLAAHALLRYGMGPRHLAGLRGCHPPGERWRPTDILMLPDGSDARMRRLRYTGPGAVMVAIEHERAAGRVEQGSAVPFRRRAEVTLAQLPEARVLRRPQVIRLASRARLLVRSGAAGRGS
jgi:hypothetical protein